MNYTSNGGPAFPVPHNYIDRFGEGVTMRDYFAAKAMQGLLTNQGPYGEDMPKPYAENVMNVDEIGQYAYAMANAMLRAREAA